MRTGCVLVIAGALVAGCAGRRDPEVWREDTAGDGLWALAEDFHAKGQSEAYAETLRFLVARYPSSRRAARARVALEEAGAGGRAP